MPPDLNFLVNLIRNSPFNGALNQQGQVSAFINGAQTGIDPSQLVSQLAAGSLVPKLNRQGQLVSLSSGQGPAMSEADLSKFFTTAFPLIQPVSAGGGLQSARQITTGSRAPSPGYAGLGDQEGPTSQRNPFYNNADYQRFRGYLGPGFFGQGDAGYTPPPGAGYSPQRNPRNPVAPTTGTGGNRQPFPPAGAAIGYQGQSPSSYAGQDAFQAYLDYAARTQGGGGSQPGRNFGGRNPGGAVPSGVPGGGGRSYTGGSPDFNFGQQPGGPATTIPTGFNPGNVRTASSFSPSTANTGGFGFRPNGPLRFPSGYGGAAGGNVGSTFVPRVPGNPVGSPGGAGGGGGGTSPNIGGGSNFSPRDPARRATAYPSAALQYDQRGSTQNPAAGTGPLLSASQTGAGTGVRDFPANYPSGGGQSQIPGPFAPTPGPINQDDLGPGGYPFTNDYPGNDESAGLIRQFLFQLLGGQLQALPGSLNPLPDLGNQLNDYYSSGIPQNIGDLLGGISGNQSQGSPLSNFLNQQIFGGRQQGPGGDPLQGIQDTRGTYDSIANYLLNNGFAGQGQLQNEQGFANLLGQGNALNTSGTGGLLSLLGGPSGVNTDAINALLQGANSTGGYFAGGGNPLTFLQSIFELGAPGQRQLEALVRPTSEGGRDLAAQGAQSLQTAAGGLGDLGAANLGQPGIQNEVQNRLLEQLGQGGLTPEYVRAAQENILRPQQEDLLGQLNTLSGGRANLGQSGVSADALAQLNSEFANNLILQGGQNYQNALQQGQSLGGQQFGQGLDTRNLNLQALSQLAGVGGQQIGGAQSSFQNVLDAALQPVNTAGNFLNTLQSGQLGGYNSQLNALQSALGAGGGLNQQALDRALGTGSLGLNMIQQLQNQQLLPLQLLEQYGQGRYGQQLQNTQLGQGQLQTLLDAIRGNVAGGQGLLGQQQNFGLGINQLGTNVLIQRLIDDARNDTRGQGGIGGFLGPIGDIIGAIIGGG